MNGIVLAVHRENRDAVPPCRGIHAFGLLQRHSQRLRHDRVFTAFGSRDSVLRMQVVGRSDPHRVDV